MFAITFQTAVSAVIQIFMLGAVGFILVRTKIIDEAGLKLLSFLMVNVFFPLFIFYKLTHFFDFTTMPNWWMFPLISMAINAAGLAIGHVLLSLRPVGLRNEFRAVVSLHNAGYLPLLLVTTLPLGEYGPVLSIYILLALIGFDSALWSLGVWLLRRHDVPGMELKNIINPPLLSMAGSLLIVAFGVQHYIPNELMQPARILGDCALPTAMIVTGGNLALTKLSNINKPDMGMVCLGKLLLMPLLGCLALLIFKPSPLIALLVVIQTAVPSATTLSVIGRYYNTRNQQFVNQAIFVTHVVSMLTLPVFLTLYGKWVQ